VNKVRDHLKTLTLLCVDSSTVINTIYEGIFHILFKEIVIANNCEDALDIYQEKKIDIIITAQVFSGKTGLEMIKIVRETNEDIPIIFVSSFRDIDLLSEAIKLKVTSFVKKPFETTDILNSIEIATKQLIAQNHIKDERKKELDKLKSKVDYSDYQENLSFQKALKVIRNDFYYKQLKETKNSITILDILYNAKDIISGDTYSTRKIDNHRNLFFIIDGMGKGLSASITAMLTVTFINRRLDANKEENIEFALNDLIEKTIKHIQKFLLEEEILSISFVLVDTGKKHIEYSSFSMPPILILDSKNEVKSIKANNPPLSCYTQRFKTDKFFYTDIEKLLFYSDGLVENSLKDGSGTYSEHIKDDFKNSITREELRKKIISKIGEQEDDITFILMTNIYLHNLVDSLVINSTLKDTEEANIWFENILNKTTKNKDTLNSAPLAFTELLLNAYEHGNLGLSGEKKHLLMKEDRYFDFLARKELSCSKKIYIDVYNFDNHLLVKIKDEGDGFDTKILANIFGINKSFNRRGILMSRNSTSGIYYNDKANQVSFIIKT